MTYIKPQVLIHQQFSQPTNSDDTTLRAMIVGPNAILHRYSDPDEKALIALGEFVPGDDKEFDLVESGISVGGVVDKDSATLYIDDALETYFTHETADGATDPDFRWTGKAPNEIVCDIEDFNFIDLDDTHTRYYKLPRDVEPGDYILLSCTSEDANTPCGTVTKLSKIVSVGRVWSESTISAATETTSNPETTVAASVPVAVNSQGVNDQTANGPKFEITKDEVTNVTGYDPYKAGKFSPEYTITVDKFITSANCSNTLTIKITSNVEDDITLNIVSGVEFKVGSFGYKGKLTFTKDNIQFADTEQQLAADKWVITEKFAYTPGSVTTNSNTPGAYIGNVNDEYIVTVIRGGVVADTVNCPLVSIKSGLGYDYLTNVRIYDNNQHYYGVNGIALTFTGTEYYSGQTFKFNVAASTPSQANSLVLQNDLPQEMRNIDKILDVKLFAKKNISLGTFNPATPDLPPFRIDDQNYLTVEGNLVVRDFDIAENGDPIDCQIAGGKLYLEFREWSQIGVGELNYCDSVSSLDLIPGQLDPANPVKYAVYKALANSNGVPVAYTVVSDPSDMDNWASAFGVIEGAEDVYSITPTSQDIRVLNQAATLIETESGAEQCRWKTGVFSISGVDTRKVVGQNVVNNKLFTTSYDGEEVKASIIPQYKSSYNTSSEPTIDDVSRTYVTITSGNASFKNSDGSDKVKPGDSLRILNGNDDSERYVVNKVVSEETVEITTNPYLKPESNKRIEVWHNLTKNEQAEYFGILASSFNTRRIMVVAPDVVGEDNMELPGYYIAAAISGLKSGVNAYQGLTRTELVGFDDFSRAKPYFTESQLNIMAENGVCIVLTDSNGTAYIRHALTTDMSTTSTQEEAITRDYDYICKNIHSILNQYIGRYNATSNVFEYIYKSLDALLQSYVSSGYITGYKDITVQSHALLSDRVEVYVTISLPYPINTIEVYVTAQKG